VVDFGASLIYHRRQLGVDVKLPSSRSLFNGFKNEIPLILVICPFSSAKSGNSFPIFD